MHNNQVEEYKVAQADNRLSSEEDDMDLDAIADLMKSEEQSFDIAELEDIMMSEPPVPQRKPKNQPPA